VQEHPEVLGITVVRKVMVLEKIREGGVRVETRLQHLDALVVILDEFGIDGHVRDELAHQCTKLRAWLPHACLDAREK
jgi:hypothetical protein